MRRLAAGLLFLLLPTTASAVPITWVLDNVLFIDNGTANGSFVFDADTGIFSDVDITTAGGAPADLYARSTDREYTALTGDASSATGSAFAFLDGPYLMSFFLHLTFDTPLTNAGGSVVVGGDEELFGIDVGAYGLRLVVSGSVVSVPEPAAAASAASILACLGWLARRRRA